MICLEALDSLLLVGGVILLFISFVGVLVENHKLRKLQCVKEQQTINHQR